MSLTSPAASDGLAARAVKVTKIYGEGDAAVRALDSVTVGFPMGNFTAIMGPSGSGKSTLMHCVAGLDDVTSGQVFLGATEVTSLNDKDLTLLRRDQVGFVFQAFAGVSDNDARAAVDPIVKDYPTVSLKDQTQFKQDLANQINKLLGLVFVLLFLAVVIAFFGIVNTLALSVFERTRELGLLRAVGMARHQVRRMIRWESIIIAVLGAVLGLGVGAFFGFAAVQAMGDIGVDRMAFPAGQLSVFVIFAALAGVVAAVFPARRAARLDVLAAIAHQ